MVRMVIEGLLSQAQMEVYLLYWLTYSHKIHHICSILYHITSIVLYLLVWSRSIVRVLQKYYVSLHVDHASDTDPPVSRNHQYSMESILEARA